jgi:hypothetical protein
MPFDVDPRPGLSAEIFNIINYFVDSGLSVPTMTKLYLNSDVRVPSRLMRSQYFSWSNWGMIGNRPW